MANPSHLMILTQGVEAWNLWRIENPSIMPDLREANLSGADLQGANLWMADLNDAELTNARLLDANLILSMLCNASITSGDLSRANLTRADLSQTKLGGANFNNAILEEALFREADLKHANFNYANLVQANLIFADMTGAKFENANLQAADCRNANLTGANLKMAYLGGVNFSAARINSADFSRAKTSETIFGYNNLKGVKGLESLEHKGPSIIGNETLSLSEGKIPEAFLRGCGLSDWEIESVKLHQASLSNEEINDILYRVHNLRATQAIQINPLFISYSHADSSFVDKIEIYLNKKGIRFWRDTHHSTAGRLEKQIDRAIRLNPTVLLVLSDRSVRSDWVEHEARLARRLEQEIGRDVLCPIALDDSWKTCQWPERLREQIMEYQIVDFSSWQDNVYFNRMFTKLIEGLELFYK